MSRVLYRVAIKTKLPNAKDETSIAEIKLLPIVTCACEHFIIFFLLTLHLFSFCFLLYAKCRKTSLLRLRTFFFFLAAT